jgi:DNA (cytosine-5)-methyltransferase 1
MHDSGMTTQPARQNGPTAIDLFCGAGGFSLGLQSAGFNILCAADAWPLAAESYRRNFSHPVVCGDLSECSTAELMRRAGVLPQRVDLVVGGPPCQGFSVQRIGADTDQRNNLVLKFAELVSEISPRFFLMENVPGLIGKRGSHLFDAFMEAVTVAGYDAEAHVVNAADYGVPQIRKRVIVVGWHRRHGQAVIMPSPTHNPKTQETVWDAICELPPPAMPGDKNPRDPLHRASRLSELNKQRLKHIPPGGGMENLPVELRVNCHKAGADKIGHRYVYGRLDGDRPASTITGHFDSFTRGRFAHPKEDRNITLREGARLQTFPDSFKFAGNQEDIAAQIGNAVPPRLAQFLGTAVLEALHQRPHGPDSLARRQTSRLTTYARVQLSLFLKGIAK